MAEREQWERWRRQGSLEWVRANEREAALERRGEEERAMADKKPPMTMAWMEMLMDKHGVPFNWAMSFDELVKLNGSLPDGHPLKDDASTWDREWWAERQAEWKRIMDRIIAGELR